MVWAIIAHHARKEGLISPFVIWLSIPPCDRATRDSPPIWIRSQPLEAIARRRRDTSRALLDSLSRFAIVEGFLCHLRLHKFFREKITQLRWYAIPSVIAKRKRDTFLNIRNVSLFAFCPPNQRKRNCPNEIDALFAAHIKCCLFTRTARPRN